MFKRRRKITGRKICGLASDLAEYAARQDEDDVYIADGISHGAFDVGMIPQTTGRPVLVLSPEKLHQERAFSDAGAVGAFALRLGVGRARAGRTAAKAG